MSLGYRKWSVSSYQSWKGPHHMLGQHPVFETMLILTRTRGLREEATASRPECGVSRKQEELRPCPWIQLSGPGTSTGT